MFEIQCRLWFFSLIFTYHQTIRLASSLCPSLYNESIREYTLSIHAYSKAYGNFSDDILALVLTVHELADYFQNLSTNATQTN